MSTTHTTNHRILTILNDGDLTDVQKVQRLREITSEINPAACTADKVYRIRVRGEETIGWRGLDRGDDDINRWTVKDTESCMRWAQDGEVTVLGEVGATLVGREYPDVDSIVAVAQEGMRIQDKDGDTGVLRKTAHQGWNAMGVAELSDRYAPFTIIYMPEN